MQQQEHFENSKDEECEKMRLSPISTTIISNPCINKAWHFYENILGSPKHILAPMVDQSELAFRKLCRRYNVNLAYTPMWHASQFVQSSTYRRQALECGTGSLECDRPLIVQFCANDPQIFLEAAKLVEHCCDAVDLNLGCPQSIAKRGHYGAFLQEEWDLVFKMISTCRRELQVPVTAKIRILSSIDKTIAYAKGIQEAGASLITIHGRTREQKGQATGVADWHHIAAVRKALSIPVIANGNIEYASDVTNCFTSTMVNGVMAAEGALHNPALFSGKQLFVWQLAEEYLEIAAKLEEQTLLTYSRGHIFKIMHHALQVHTNVRDAVANARNIADLLSAVNNLKHICGPEKCQEEVGEEVASLPFPHWICQPYRRRPLAKFNEITTNQTNLSETTTATLNDKSATRVLNPIQMERQERKRLKRERKSLIASSDKPKRSRSLAPLCVVCNANPKGTRCEFDLCRACCKEKTKAEIVNCQGHNFLRYTWSLKSVTQESSAVDPP